MSSSKSSQQANTSTTDQRRVLGQGALSAENSTVYQSTTTLNQTLDADVANKAMDTARLSASAALGFGSDALTSALDAVGKNDARAFNFGGDALAGTIDAVGKNDVRAFSFGGDALASAFSFATDAAKRENAALDQTTSVLSSAYADAKGRGALTDKILIGAICAVAVIAYMAIKK
jgi:hypothetical protein